MAYNPNIPNASDKFSQSQAQIKENFQAIAPLFEQGIQQWVALPVQGTAPTFDPGDEGLYNLNYAVTSKNELFVHKQTAAGTADIPMTASSLSITAAPATFSSGYTMLPSGIQLRWGQLTGSGSQIVTISGGTPFNGIITILVCPYDSSNGDVNIAARLGAILSTTQFKVYISSRTSTGAATGTVNYLIIGY
jgi:hypothetical protein